MPTFITYCLVIILNLHTFPTMFTIHKLLIPFNLFKHPGQVLTFHTIIVTYFSSSQYLTPRLDNSLSASHISPFITSYHINSLFVGIIHNPHFIFFHHIKLHIIQHHIDTSMNYLMICLDYHTEINPNI